MRFSVAVYQAKRGPYLVWTTLGLGRFTRTRSATLPGKVEQLLAADLRELVRAARPEELRWLEPRRGLRLERVRLELPLRRHGGDRTFTGEVPLVLEERPWTRADAVTIAYHPARQEEWFPVPEGRSLVVCASRFLSRAWGRLDEDALEALRTNRKDVIRPLAFSATPRSLLAELRAKEDDVWRDLKEDPTRGGKEKARKLEVLPALGEDLTAAICAYEEGPAAGLPPELGLARTPVREQLGELLAGGRRPSVFLVGPPGSGKTTALSQWIWDLARAEGWGEHRNADLLTHVWRVSGKRLLAGMSFVGEWEQRLVDLLAELRGKKIVLHVPDLVHFGRLGRARGSDRALADLLRGPVARGEVSILAEGTSTELARLVEEAPAFAGLFVRVAVPEPAPDVAFRMLLAAARAAELETGIRVTPLALRALLELSASFASASALPRRALDLLRHVLRAEEARRATTPAAERPPLDTREVAGALSEQLGVPRALLDRAAVVDRAEVARLFAEQVMGQPDAVDAAADVVVRVKAGLGDPRRPFGVLLFAGPTGTGKTELAKCLAEYLFGSPSRLVRFDMSELSGPDAAARLVGDAWAPEGALVRAVREQPLSVVLLDEIEKAHPSVHALLLQLFEDARLTDAAGSTASFQGTVVVLTSNLGARRSAPIGVGRSAEDGASDAERAAREFFSPELFNRIDRVVTFRPLSPAVAVDVAEKELEKLRGRRGLASRDVFVEVGRAVVERLAAEAIVSREGARSLKRLLEDRVAAPLAEVVAGRPGALLRMLYLFEDPSSPGGFALRDEPLEEAAPLPDAASGGDPEELDAGALLVALEAAAPRVQEGRARVRRALEAGPGASGDGRWLAEALLARADALDEELEEILGRGRGREPPSDPTPRWEEHAHGRGRDHVRARVRLTAPSAARRPAPASREARLGALLRCRHVARCVEEQATGALDDGALVEIVRIASPKAPRLRQLVSSPAGASRAALPDWLARAYVAFARELEPRGTVVGASLRPGGEPLALAGEAELSRELAARPELVVLALPGLGVRAALAHEAGCHVWQALGAGPEIVRVRVLPPAAAASPVALARDFVARRAAFRAALDRGAGGSPPENPAGLAPIVRTLRFDPPSREGRAGPLGVEDYRLGLAVELPAADPSSVLVRLLVRRALLGTGGAP